MSKILYYTIVLFCFVNCNSERKFELSETNKYKSIIDNQYFLSDLEDLEKYEIKMEKIGLNEKGYVWTICNFFNKETIVYLNKEKVNTNLSNKGLTFKIEDQSKIPNPSTIQFIDTFLNFNSKLYNVEFDFNNFEVKILN